MCHLRILEKIKEWGLVEPTVRRIEQVPVSPAGGQNHPCTPWSVLAAVLFSTLLHGLADGTVCSSAALLVPPNWDQGLLPPRESLQAGAMGWQQPHAIPPG